MSGRLLAIGDIHGCDKALEVLLARLEPTAEDTVVVLGDVVDRGPDSRRAVELLLDLRNGCRLQFLLGNHEQMMLDAFRRKDLFYWLQVGGAETLDSYGGTESAVPEEHIRFLESGAPWFETDGTVFVHAFLEPGVPLDRQNADWLRWYKVDGTEPAPMPGKRVVCGHTSQKDGRPAVRDGWVCIDTWACGGGWLSCLDVETDRLWQARQTGESRSGIALDEFRD